MQVSGRSGSRLNRRTLWEKFAATHWIGVTLRCRAGLDASTKRTITPLSRIEPWFFGCPARSLVTIPKWVLRRKAYLEFVLQDGLLLSSLLWTPRLMFTYLICRVRVTAVSCTLFSLCACDFWCTSLEAY
jgi:hypothetical protein